MAIGKVQGYLEKRKALRISCPVEDISSYMTFKTCKEAPYILPDDILIVR